MFFNGCVNNKKYSNFVIFKYDVFDKVIYKYHKEYDGYIEDKECHAFLCGISSALEYIIKD